MQDIVLGGGCFWCLEASYQLIRGVDAVVPGYAGGESQNPDYYHIGDHAEVVRVSFNKDVISLEQLLDVFWAIHDPTMLNRQGNDVGPQYRSIILYANDNQKAIAEQSMNGAQKLWQDPIVTELKQLDIFHEAEPEHHNYFQSHPEQAYCQIIINPKLKKLREKFTKLLK